MPVRPFHPDDLPALVALTIETFRPFYEDQVRPAYGERLFRLHHGDWRQDYEREVPALHDPATGHWIAVAEAATEPAGSEASAEPAGSRTAAEAAAGTAGSRTPATGPAHSRTAATEPTHSCTAATEPTRSRTAATGPARSRTAAAEPAGTPVGLVAWSVSPTRPDHGRIELLAVAAAHRGAGHGRHLCDHALAALRAAGAKVVEIGTGDQDHFHAPARALYETLGFLKVPIAGYITTL
jgi:ribosomal protein S18 acetylase RimI-like enzyme